MQLLSPRVLFLVQKPFLLLFPKLCFFNYSCPPSDRLPGRSSRESERVFTTRVRHSECSAHGLNLPVTPFSLSAIRPK